MMETIQRTACTAPALTNPYAAKAQAPAAPADPQDTASVTGGPAPDAAEEKPSHLGKYAAITAAGLAGLALFGAVIPSLTATQQPQPVQISIPASGLKMVQQKAPVATPPGQAQPAQPGDGQQQPQDPTQVILQMAQIADATSQNMQQISATQNQWNATMQDAASHYQSYWQNADALFRDPNVNADQHWAAMQQHLAAVRQDMAQLKTQISQSQKSVDTGLGQDVQAQTQVGTISYNLSGQLDQAAGQYGWFSPQRSAIKDISGDFRQASYDLAVASNNAANSQAGSKVMVQNIDYLEQNLFSKMADNVAKKDLKSNNFEQLSDAGKQIMPQMSKAVSSVAEATSKGGSLSHKAAQEIVSGLLKLSGGNNNGETNRPTAPGGQFQPRGIQ